MNTSPAMRELTFTFRERLVLVPVELVGALKPLFISGSLLFLLVTLLGRFSPNAGLMALIAYLGAALAGIVAGPLFLPWLPGRSFAVKGAVAGLAWSTAWYQLAGGDDWRMATTIAAFLALPAVSAFFTLNFTGSTPFTSRTGVKKEMRLSLPVMGLLIAGSGLVWLGGKLF